MTDEFAVRAIVFRNKTAFFGSCSKYWPGIASSALHQIILNQTKYGVQYIPLTLL
jgi:hypothetical protein